MGRNLLITLGVGNFMEGAGVIAEPVVAPMLHAAGVSPTGSAALSIVGYAGIMTLEMAGIIVTVPFSCIAPLQWITWTQPHHPNSPLPPVRTGPELP